MFTCPSAKLVTVKVYNLNIEFADWQTGWQAGRQAGKRPDTPANWHAGCPAAWQTAWRVYKFEANWLTHRLANRKRTGWLAGKLTKLLAN